MAVVMRWVMGAVLALLGIIGLVIASQARDDMMYFFGLMMFVFTVLYIFGFIGRYVGQGHGKKKEMGEPVPE